MRFRFKLEKALSFFEGRERLKKMELVNVMQKISILREKKKFLDEGVGGMLSYGRSDIRFSALENEKVPFSLDQGALTHKQISEAEQYLNLQKEELRSIQSRRKALEELKSKRYRDFRVDKNRKDQRFLDETYRLMNLVKK